MTSKICIMNLENDNCPTGQTIPFVTFFKKKKHRRFTFHTFHQLKSFFALVVRYHCQIYDLERDIFIIASSNETAPTNLLLHFYFCLEIIRLLL